MLEGYNSNVGSMSSYSVPVMVDVVNWREEAVAACQKSEIQVTDRLQQDLASRVLEIAGQVLDTRSISTDYTARAATAVVEGSLFQLRRGDLFLVRPCVYCGVRSFESSPIHDLVELGHALSVWQPRCTGCDLEDEDWTHSF